MSVPPAPKSRAYAIAVVALMVVAAVLRFSGIGAGAPFRMGVDEPVVISKALHMMKSGDFNPHFFDYGGLTFYLHLAVASIRFVIGALRREWLSLDQVWEGDFIVASRFVTAALGTLTVYLVYRCALRWGRPTALMALATMALLSQHVRESHFALTDTPLTLLVTVTFLLSLRAAETPKLGTFLAAGVAAGAAAAIKYNGGVAMVMPLAAAFAATTVIGVGRAMLVATAGTVLGFLVAAPYSLLDLPAFLNGFAHLAGSYNQPRPPAVAAVTYLKYLRGWFGWSGVLPTNMGWIAVLVAGLGLLVHTGQLFRAATRVRSLVLLVFSATFFWLIAHQSSLQYGRYLLPLGPMLAIAIGTGVVTFGALGGRMRRFGVPALAAVLLLPPLATGIGWNLQARQIQTPDLAGQWMITHAKPGDRVVVESEVVGLPPKYPVTDVNHLIDVPLDDYRRDGVQYLIGTSTQSDRYFADPAGRAGQLAAYQDLLRSTEMVVAFRPTPDHPGPTVTILRVPK